MSDWKVKIEYKNENLETVVEKEYEFIDYIEKLSGDIRQILWDVENAFYTFAGNKEKKDWEPELRSQFEKIRHKILNQSNAVKRLPQNLSYKAIPANTMSFSEYLARNIK